MGDAFIPDLVIAEETPTTRKRRRRWVGAMLGLTFVVGVGYWYIQVVQAVREAARRSQCLCNLCQITMALHNYHASNGSLPPAFGIDDDGKPRVSWRVSILPYMEQSNLFNAYNFAQPWDSADNGKLNLQMPMSYGCPSRDPAAAQRGFTSYVAIRGPGTMFPGAHLVTFDDIKDGLSNTIAIVEVVNVDIPWTAPMDLDAATMSYVINDPKRPGLSSNHPGGLNIGMGDGRKLFLKNATTPERLKALISIRGGEAVDIDEVTRGGVK